MSLRSSILAVVGFTALSIGSAQAQQTAPTTSTPDNAPQIERKATITLKSGQELSGTTVRETADTVYFRLRGNTDVIAYPKSSLDLTDYQKTSFFETGASFGTPAGINLIVGYRWKMLGLRVSGSYLGKISGSQVEIPISLSRKVESCKDISLVFMQLDLTAPKAYMTQYGQTYTVQEHQFYSGYGAMYHSNSNGFDWEVGLVFGSGTFGSPQLVGQIGYVYQFR